MRYTFSTLLLCAFLLFNSNVISRDKQDASCVIVQQSNLKVYDTRKGTNAIIVDGEDLVFKIKDPVAGTIYFEVNTNRRFFNYTPYNLSQLNIVAFDSSGKKLLVEGSVSGFKIFEGFWKVELSLNVDGNSINFSERVKVSNYSL